MSTFIDDPMSIDIFIAGLPGSTLVSPEMAIFWPAASIAMVTCAVVAFLPAAFMAATKAALSLYGWPAAGASLVVAELAWVCPVAGAGLSLLPQAATPRTAGRTMAAAARRRVFHFMCVDLLGP
jgi:hypothetical protein